MISSVSRAPPLVTTPTAPRVFQSMMLFEPIVPVSPSSWPSMTTTEPSRSSAMNGSGDRSRYHCPSNCSNSSGFARDARLLVGT